MPSLSCANKQESAFFADAGAGAAELKLAYALENSLDLALLIGEPGFGKTTVLRRFAHRAAAQGHILVDVFFPQLNADQLVAFIDGELGAPDDLIGRARNASLRRIARRAHQLARQNRAMILLIDDAHLLDDRDALEVLHSLLNLRDRESVQLTIVLAGEKTLLANLARVPALAGRVGVTAVLSPLDLDATRAYLRHRSRVAQRPIAAFHEDIVQRLHQETAGNPRALNRIAEMAALLARAEGRENVTLDDLENLKEESWKCEE